MSFVCINRQSFQGRSRMLAYGSRGEQSRYSCPTRHGNMSRNETGISMSHIQALINADRNTDGTVN